tara:strand:- start:12312 stop:13763 length:1452 start_codon:yes stop_codon:yes gene_type:complete
MFLPIQTSTPIKRVPYVVIAITFINVLLYIFFATGLLDSNDFALVPKELFFADPSTSSGLWEYFTLLSSVFNHAELDHLLGNMLFLWVFGPLVEERLGSWRFMALYMLSDVGGNALFLWLSPESTSYVLGASGAISGVVGAFFLKFPREKIGILVHIEDGTRAFFAAYIFLTAWIGSQLLFLWKYTIEGGHTTGVAFASHVGGILAGVLLMGFMAGFRSEGQDTLEKPLTLRSQWKLIGLIFFFYLYIAYRVLSKQGISFIEWLKTQPVWGKWVFFVLYVILGLSPLLLGLFWWLRRRVQMRRLLAEEHCIVCDAVLEDTEQPCPACGYTDALQEQPDCKDWVFLYKEIHTLSHLLEQASLKSDDQVAFADVGMLNGEDVQESLRDVHDSVETLQHLWARYPDLIELLMSEREDDTPYLSQQELDALLHMATEGANHVLHHNRHMANELFAFARELEKRLQDKLKELAKRYSVEATSFEEGIS